MNNKELGAKLRQLRKEQKLMQKDVAQQAGITASMLCKIENGTSVPSIETVKAITKALNIKTSSVITWGDFPEEEELIPLIRKAEDWQIKAIKAILNCTQNCTQKISPK